MSLSTNNPSVASSKQSLLFSLDENPSQEKVGPTLPKIFWTGAAKEAKLYLRNRPKAYYILKEKVDTELARLQEKACEAQRVQAAIERKRNRRHSQRQHELDVAGSRSIDALGKRRVSLPGKLLTSLPPSSSSSLKRGSIHSDSRKSSISSSLHAKLDSLAESLQNQRSSPEISISPSSTFLLEILSRQSSKTKFLMEKRIDVRRRMSPIEKFRRAALLVVRSICLLGIGKRKEEGQFQALGSHGSDHNWKTVCGMVHMTSDLKRILAKEKRSGAEVRILMERIANRMHSFSTYSPKIQYELCSVMTYNSFEAGKVIIRQGHPPGNFYFVLSGTVEVIKSEMNDKTNKMEDIIMMTMGTDQVFGELALLDNTPRAASVICKTAVELLIVEGEAYRRILDSIARKEAHLKEKLVKECPLFQTFSVDVKNVVAACHLGEFSPNTPILIEGEISEKVYFITKGSCKLVRRSKFIQKKGNPTGEPLSQLQERRYNGPTSCYRPGQPIKSNEEVISKLLVVGNLKLGDVFGLGNIYSSAKKYSLNDMLESKQTCEEVSTVSSDKVECLMLSRVNFLKFFTENTLDHLQKKYQGGVSMMDLESNYLNQVKWNLTKARFIRNMVKDSNKKRRDKIIPSSLARTYD